MTVTLLITTYNRGKLLQQGLKRLCELTKPDELLVIDDGGTDDTQAICNQFVNQLPIRYVYHDHPGVSICSYARNVGIKLATSDLIITCEPEIVFITDVIAQMLAVHNEDRDRVISAGCIHHTHEGSTWEVARNQEPTGLGWVAPYVALYEKAWLEAVGGWDESFPGNWGWDDTDLLTRLRIDGHGQNIDLDIEIVHQWHTLGSDVGSVNAAHFAAKSFHEPNVDLTDVIANRGKAWGILHTRNS